MFSYLKFFAVFIAIGSTILFSKNGRLKDGNIELCTLFIVINKFLNYQKNKEIKVKKNIKKISA